MQSPAQNVVPDPTPQLVFQALSAIASGDSSADVPLKTWEADAAPGFLGLLVEVVGRPEEVNEAVRMLAAIVAKNAVGSSWRKTMGSREWSRIPTEEKKAVRDQALRLLYSERSDAIAIQLGLLITNIARFDFPAPWEELLSHLRAGASWRGPASMRDKQRSLFTLKNVVRALRGKRFVIEPSLSQDVDVIISPHEMAALTERISAERDKMVRQVEGLFGPLAADWQELCGSLIHGHEHWQERAALANRHLFVLREILQTVSSWDEIDAHVIGFFQATHHALSALHGVQFQDGEDPDDRSSRATLASLACERITQCVTSALDKNPLGFARFLPHFLPLYVHSALLSPSAQAVQRVRAKRRVVTTRFMSRALLCPLFRPEIIASQKADKPNNDALLAKWQEEVSRMEMAENALSLLLAEDQCGPLVEAVIIKYLSLSPDELQEWQEDPEGFVRSADVESSPDADTPRACGVALLLCLFERGGKRMSNALLALAARLQGEAQSNEHLVMREACYRAMGEALGQVEGLVDFNSWYQNELRGIMLSCLQGQHEVNGAGKGCFNLLAARAAWLLGNCGQELQPEVWADALSLLAALLQCSDLVVALAACAAATLLAGAVLEEEQFVRRRANARAPEGLLPAHLTLSMPLAALFGEPAFLGAPDGNAEEAFNTKMKALEGSAARLLPALFELLARLGEVESMVRALQLVSILVEVLGRQALPVLGTIAEYLPKVWMATQNAASGNKETGAIGRLHSALMAVLTHLVSRLGFLAISHPAVEAVLFPLLAHALDTRQPHQDLLIDEALPLVQATLTSTPSIAQPHMQMLRSLVQVVGRSNDVPAMLHVLDAYLLLGPPDILQPYLQPVTALLARCIQAAAQALSDAQNQPTARFPAMPSLRSKAQKGAAKEAMEEAVAAAGLVATLLATSLHSSAPALVPLLKIMARLVGSDAAPAPSQRGRSMSVAEAFLEALSPLLYAQPQALPELLDRDQGAQAAYIERWLAIATAKRLEEVLGFVGMTPVGRLRRHRAAVALGRVASSGCCPAFDHAPLLARVLALAITSSNEQPKFQTDQEALTQVMSKHTGNGKAPEEQDHVAVKRLSLAQCDPLRLEPAENALTSILQCSHMTQHQAAVLEALGFIDHNMETGIRNMLTQHNSPHDAFRNLSLNGASAGHAHPQSVNLID